MLWAGLDRPGAIPSLIGLAALLLFCLGYGLVRVVEHRDAARRAMTAGVNALAEDLFGAGEASGIQRKIEDVLPALLGVSGVRMFLANRKNGRLMETPSAEADAPLSFDPKSPPEGVAELAARVWRERTALAIPDARRTHRAGLPRSILLAPMVVQGEATGVLAVYRSERAGGFRADERDAVQHLANHAAAAIEMEERQRLHEQLSRSEKLTATGQLLSQAAGELRAPVNAIVALSEQLAAGASPDATGLRTIADQARRASGMVDRLLSFGRPEVVRTQPVDLGALAASLVRFRERDWKALGIEAAMTLGGQPVVAEGSPSQLEQMMLEILKFAELSQTGAGRKRIEIDVRAAGRQAMAGIGFQTARASAPVSGLADWRRVLEAQGGELRFSTSGEACRFEVVLPLSERAAPEAADRPRTRVRTMLVVEPEPGLRRRLVLDLSARLYRVVPVATGEEAIDLAHRFRFDAAMCSTSLPGAAWTECRDRLRDRVGAFVALSEGFEAELAREGLVLHKSTYDADLDAVLSSVEQRLEKADPAATRV